jgi:glycerol dehydrogenase
VADPFAANNLVPSFAEQPEIVARAPTRLLVAGMGDALSSKFEARACEQAFSTNVIGEHGSMTAYALAELCYHVLLEHGLAAKVACDNNVVVPALEHVIEANTLLSGIGFESELDHACIVAGSMPCSSHQAR